MPQSTNNPDILSYDQYRAAKRFRGLDGLCALSVIIVISAHIHMTEQPFLWLAGSGGVAVFFVLSGFLITTLALREEQDSGSLNLRAFYIRRSLRIFPAYYYVLGITALLAYGATDPGHAARWNAAMPYYLLYFNEFAPTANFFHSWSLGLEEKFYLLWPFIAFVGLKARRQWRFILAAAVALFLLVRPLGRFFFLVGDYGYIAIGCLLALCLHERRFYDRLSLLARPGWSWLVVTAFVVTHFAVSHRRVESNPIADFSYALAIALLLTSVVTGNPRCSRPLDWGWLRFVGVRAYGIYLVHLLCVGVAQAVFIEGSGKDWVAWGAYLTSTLLSVACAAALYQFVEKPLIKYGRKRSGAILSTAPS
ncbi:MAG: acyltransferase [Acidobacteria bacterium]|nr:acyltransferase [Acidobacteriota bacterium]